jgi:hypothetical protein
MAAIPRLVNNEWWMLTIANLSDNDIYGDLPIHLTCDGRSAEIGCSHAPVAQSTGQGARSKELTRAVVPPLRIHLNR